MTIKESELLEQRSDQQIREIGAKVMEMLPFETAFSFGPLIRHLREKVVKSEGAVAHIISDEVMNLIEQVPEIDQPQPDYRLYRKHPDVLEVLINCVLPPAGQENQLAKIGPPFSVDPIYKTPALNRLLNEGELKYEIRQSTDLVYCASVINACAMILNRHYGKQISVDPPVSISVLNSGTKLERHFKTHMDLTFLDVVAVKPLKPLSDQDIHRLLGNIYDLDLWLEHIPPENFKFEGFIIGRLTDITEEEALSRLKFKLLEQDAVVTLDNIRLLENLVRQYLGISDLQLGLTAIDYPSERASYHRYKIRFDMLAGQQDNLICGPNQNSIYEKACRYKEVLLIEDLDTLPQKTPAEKDLLGSGIRSIIVAPLLNKNEEVIGLLEVGSPEAYQLHSFIEVKLKEIVSLFSLAVERSREEIDNQVEAVIREQYTAVHPSVEWRFVETAYDLLEQRLLDPAGARLDPIVFHEVFPLYAQADIVNSSMHRNASIQSDLAENLDLVIKALQKVVGNIRFPLANQYLDRLRKERETLARDFSSNDESRLVELLHQDVHPMLMDFREQYPDELAMDLTNYFNALDPQLGIIYKKRKAYEDSVSLINSSISRYLDLQQEEAQKVLPHYFEKYKTDGVEYDLYVGQSLLHRGTFKPMHLKNLRLWQLQDMCEITRLVHHLQSEMPVELDTAQLIFVFGNPLSIRFRMDEKKFDVDGAYNVRYEILKKRIDKAYVNGRRERLTQAGKVAIVYLNEKDRVEYLDAIAYLDEKGYVDGEVEELELARLQGVSGLRALRFAVKLLDK